MDLLIENLYCSSIPNRKVKEKYKYLYVYHYFENIFFELKSLEILLKKCPNIKSIELKPCAECDYNPVFRLITKYCNNLREIDLCKNRINDENIEEFQQKFGQKIYFTYFKKRNDYNLCSDIKKITELYLKPESNKLFSRLKLNKLKKLEVKVRFGEEEMLRTCIDAFPTLSHFWVNRFGGFSSNQSSRIFELTSNLKNLKHFCFRNVNIKNIKHFCDLLKRMAKNCRKLKGFEFGFEMKFDNSELRQFLSVFVAFPELRRLNLYIKRCRSMNFDINQLFPFEALKENSNITHLILDIDDYINLNFLKHIDIYLLKLQYLEIISIFDTTPEGVTQITDILSRISRLQTLKLLNLRKNVDYIV